MKSTGERRRRHPVNALVDGICSFLTRYQPEKLLDSSITHAGENGRSYGDGSAGQQSDVSSSTVLSVEDIPKRYTLYHPMLLLNSTFASHNSLWQHFFTSLSDDQEQLLFRTVVDRFCSSGQHVTHVAMNAPIDLPVKSMAQALAPVARSGVARTNGSGITAASISDENIMRSPTNLRPLYGDFGPDSLFSTRESGPGQADSDAAFWVETSQLSGIRQVWAPRWTMFSRGNIREKGRILGQQSTFPGLTEEDLNQPLPAIDVVDFYVGIGYFALSYLKRGIRRVFGWEINGWSVEGLRRGCERNGWQCLTVSVSADVEGRDRAVGVVVKALHDMCDLRCIVFHGDNQFAEGTMAAVRDVLKKEEVAINVRHCNLGLLPTSKGSWEGGVSCIDTKWGGWLHVHENAEISQVEVKRQAILDILAAMVKTKKGNGWQISCEHTEMVKTYAPGVGHFVFDIKLWPAR